MLFWLGIFGTYITENLWSWLICGEQDAVCVPALLNFPYFLSFLCLNFFIYVIRIIVFASYGVVVAFSEACAEDLE